MRACWPPTSCVTSYAVSAALPVDRLFAVVIPVTGMKLTDVEHVQRVEPEFGEDAADDLDLLRQAEVELLDHRTGEHDRLQTALAFAANPLDAIEAVRRRDVAAAGRAEVAVAARRRARSR